MDEDTRPPAEIMRDNKDQFIRFVGHHTVDKGRHRAPRKSSDRIRDWTVFLKAQRSNWRIFLIFHCEFFPPAKFLLRKVRL